MRRAPRTGPLQARGSTPAHPARHEQQDAAQKPTDEPSLKESDRTSTRVPGGIPFAVHAGVDWDAVLRAAARWALLFGGSTLAFKRIKALNLHEGRLPIEAGAHAVSLAHGAWSAAAAFVAAPGLLRVWAPSEYMRSVGHRPSTPTERAILEKSLGYFVWDLVYLLVWERDPLYFVHHAATITNWATCLRLGRGERSMFACMGYGECTSPLLNLWWFAKHAKQPRLARRLSRLFTVAFLLMRLGVFPAFCAKYVQSVWSGEMGKMIHSERLARLWAVVNVLAVSGGVVWSKSLIKGYLKDSRRAAALQ